MTSEQLEHLHLLKKHLENLLATAEKRTPGEWGYYWGWDLVYSDSNGQRKMIADCVDREEPTEQVRDDMAFIASCAGNAEAGWQSTLAAIDLLLEMERQGCSFSYFPTAESILAEWPLESLKS